MRPDWKGSGTQPPRGLCGYCWKLPCPAPSAHPQLYPQRLPSASGCWTGPTWATSPGPLAAHSPSPYLPPAVPPCTCPLQSSSRLCSVPHGSTVPTPPSLVPSFLCPGSLIHSGGLSSSWSLSGAHCWVYQQHPVPISCLFSLFSTRM